MTEEQKSQFEELSKRLIEWLCVNGHPHMTVVITPTSAELLEGVVGVQTTEFVTD